MHAGTLSRARSRMPFLPSLALCFSYGPALSSTLAMVIIDQSRRATGTPAGLRGVLAPRTGGNTCPSAQHGRCRLFPGIRISGPSASQNSLQSRAPYVCEEC